MFNKILINRIPVQRLVNHQRLLLKSKPFEHLFLRSASHGHEHGHGHKDPGEWIFKLYDPKTPLLYRRIGEKQDTDDYYLTIFAIAMIVACSSINVYMNWDEYKFADTPGYSTDLNRFTDAELGIPSDDLGYAPLNPEILKQGKVIDLGNTLRNENRQVYHAYMVRSGQQSPYDI